MHPCPLTAGQNDYLSITIGELLSSEVDPGFFPYIRLIGPTGVVVASTAHTVGAAIAVYAPLSGTYTVIVADYNANRTGDYILHLVKAPGTKMRSAYVLERRADALAGA